MCLILRSSELLEPITITSPVIEPDEKEKEKESEKLPEDIASIDVRPPCTSPDPNFGTEVRGKME